ncbi:MAG: flavodoxin family protein, partial [Acetobacteraceae bacterium]
LIEAGHEVTDVDLYAENFDPVMSRQERLDYLNTDRNERPVKRTTLWAQTTCYPRWRPIR